jgi:hypothetical protein
MVGIEEFRNDKLTDCHAVSRAPLTSRSLARNLNGDVESKNGDEGDKNMF